ncbi:MAG TPA: hypothetical protein VGF13_11160 [Verrucomicrobiae bacterium]|jgi:hypothetical protein
MKEESTRLPWTSWLVVFAPAIVSAAANTFVAAQRLRGMESLNLLMGTSVTFGIVLNLVCAPLAGIRFARHRKPTTWRALHAAAYALLFFVLNLLLLPVGCVVAGGVSKVLAK